jgi:hypothetical protein
MNFKELIESVLLFEVAHYNYITPFLEYIKVLQSVDKSWPELEEVLKDVKDDLTFKKLYLAYEDLKWGLEDRSDSSLYYEGRGI